jgi:hypothetical protein
MDLVSLLNSSLRHLLTICRLSVSIRLLLPLYFIIPAVYIIERTQILEKVAETLPSYHDEDTKDIKIENCASFTRVPLSLASPITIHGAQKNSVRSLGDSRANTYYKIFSRI